MKNAKDPLFLEVLVFTHFSKMNESLFSLGQNKNLISFKNLVAFNLSQLL